MGSDLLTNLDYRGEKFNFERDCFETLEDMKSAHEGSYPSNGFIAYCKETDDHYEFRQYDNPNPTTGKWKRRLKNGEIPSGPYSNRPLNIKPGVAQCYFCTDRKAKESDSFGVVIFSCGNDKWVDAFGREIV